MAASLNRFYSHCVARNIQLPSRGFSLRYHTTIPRQVGLSGSSAIVTAIVRSLLEYYSM